MRTCTPCEAGFRPDLAELLPEAERTVDDRQLRRDGQPVPPQIEQQHSPIGRTFATTVGEADQFLRAFRGRADDDENYTALQRSRRACRWMPSAHM